MIVLAATFLVAVTVAIHVRRTRRAASGAAENRLPSCRSASGPEPFCWSASRGMMLINLVGAKFKDDDE